MSRFVIISCLFYGAFAISYEKTWLPDNDIFNKVNQNPSEENCGKVKFNDYNEAPIILQNITSKEFVLPIEGELILLDGSSLVILDEESKEEAACLDLKPSKYHLFLRGKNWYSESTTDNMAVPDSEKIPCRYDKIKFPRGLSSAVGTKFLPSWYSVSYLQFENEDFEDLELQTFKTSDLGEATFYDEIAVNGLSVVKEPCDDPAGCTCTRKNVNFFCGPSREPKCENGVKPYGFCDTICGAYIIISPRSSFLLHTIENDLKKYHDIDTHVSRVWTSPEVSKIQIVFVEKEYKGDSVVYAKEYSDKLQKNYRLYGIRRVEEVKYSGAEISGHGPLFMMTATLLFVGAIFGAIYIFYGSDVGLNIGWRMTPAIPLSSTYRARFSAGGDSGHLIVDDHSLGGSVIDLRSSFENPVYGEVDTSPNLNEERDNVNSLLELAVKINHKLEEENKLVDIEDRND